MYRPDLTQETRRWTGTQRQVPWVRSVLWRVLVAGVGFHRTTCWISQLNSRDIASYKMTCLFIKEQHLCFWNEDFNDNIHWVASCRVFPVCATSKWRYSMFGFEIKRLEILLSFRLYLHSMNFHLIRTFIRGNAMYAFILNIRMANTYWNILYSNDVTMNFNNAPWNA